ncbi:hypothetical protein [Flavobacterium psychrophilum]|uniref:hypothetical protein n=1 Tax=Flavobacterium psychrophilum TaxID=96345 RepID=UPI0006187B85|nr:hypothetical protein [Flavobacterium psychrophilum]OAE90318.1 hypothetical protein SU65_11265 [Flavobacterium psychrophilum]
MKNELWNKLEMFIGTPLVNMAIPHYVNEIEQQLTPEQLEPLGDLTEMLTERFSEKTDTPAKEIINGLIHLAKLGVIKKNN